MATIFLYVALFLCVFLYVIVRKERFIVGRLAPESSDPAKDFSYTHDADSWRPMSAHLQAHGFIGPDIGYRVDRENERDADANSFFHGQTNSWCVSRAVESFPFSRIRSSNYRRHFILATNCYEAHAW